MISRKRLTKLIDPAFRRSVLSSMTPAKKAKYKIPQFARYTVDSCIVHRDASRENDREYGYGFTPIQCMAACMDDGSIAKRFFEFNSVNHFLRQKDGDSAVEVVEAILVEWAKEDRHIVDFDMDRIDAEFARIEAEYKEAEAEKTRLKAAQDEASARIRAAIDPIVEEERAKGAEGLGRRLLERAEAAIAALKTEGAVADAKAAVREEGGETFLNVGFKAAEGGEYAVLACHVKKPDAGKGAE